jgi:tetratricopeptide (TPR) repeat protein
MKIALGLFCLIACSLAPARGAAAAAIQSFDQAGKLYEQKQYSKAFSIYEDLIHHDKISPAILFNAGNAAFKSKQIGRAIAHYREALQLAPRDPDIQANLRFARNTVENGAQTSRIADRFSRIFTLNELSIITAIFLWLWFGLLAIREGKPVLRPALRGYTLLVGLFFAGFALWLGTLLLLAINDHPGVVVANEAAARFGPLEESQVAFTLRDGTEVQILASRAGWVEIKDSRARHGWLAQGSVEALPSLGKRNPG